MIKQGEIVDYARAAPIKRDAIGICRLVQEELDIYIPSGVRNSGS